MSLEARFDLPTFEEDIDPVQMEMCKCCAYNNVCTELPYCIMEDY